MYVNNFFKQYYCTYVNYCQTILFSGISLYIIQTTSYKTHHKDHQLLPLDSWSSSQSPSAFKYNLRHHYQIKARMVDQEQGEDWIKIHIHIHFDSQDVPSLLE